MGNCRYCGKPVGLFRSAHEECVNVHQLRERVVEGGRQRIVMNTIRSLREGGSLADLETSISEIERTLHVSPDERSGLLYKAWEGTVEQFLDDGLLDSTEEERLSEFIGHFKLSPHELNRNGTLERVGKAAVLRQVLEGNPQGLASTDDLPMNFQRDEFPVWIFKGAKYLEDKTLRKYEGASHGYSVRVMKGVYLRASAFKGHPIEYTERVHLDTGTMVATTKHIYFSGPSKSFRLQYDKIVSFQPFRNGVGIVRDAASAKPQFFEVEDGWFAYNLLSNLARHA